MKLLRSHGVLLIMMALLLAAGALHLVTMAAASSRNIGMVQVLKAFFAESADNNAGADWLDRAADGSDPFQEQRRILQTSVLLGSSDRARDSLIALGERAADDPMTYYFGVEAAALADLPDVALSLFEDAPFADNWVVAGEQAARVLLQSGRYDEVIAVRPQDLATNYQLWQMAMAQGDVDSAEISRQRLQQFTYDAIAPQDDFLFAQALQTMPLLVEQGIWEQTQLERVLTMLVWQRYDNELVADTVQQLAQRDSNTIWPFLQAEVLQRRGELDAARQLYQTVAAANPTDTRAQARLNQLDDITTIELPAPETQLATSLSLPDGAITTGANLIDNGDFETWQPGYAWLPDQWITSPYLIGDYATDGMAVQNADMLDARAGSSARVDGLWQREPHSAQLGYDYRGQNPARVASGQTYLFSLAYRTESLADDDVVAWFNNLDDDTQQADNFERVLPATHGAWRTHLCIVEITTPDDFSSTIHLRNRGTGRVWFDDVALQPLTLPPDTPISAEWHC